MVKDFFFIEKPERPQQWLLEMMSAILNSNESFRLDVDDRGGFFLPSFIVENRQLVLFSVQVSEE